MSKLAVNKAVAEVLVKKNLLNPSDAETYLAESHRSREPLNTYLVRRGILTGAQILEALAEGLGMDVIDLKQAAVEKSVIERVPVRFASYYKIMPVSIDGSTLTLASAMPLDVRIQDELRVHLGMEPKIALALEADIYEALKKYYGLASDTIDKILAKEPEKRRITLDSSKWVEDIDKKSEDPSVAKLVNQILLEAYQKRATDIHIEPYRNKVRLRYRIDGVLVDANLPPEARHFLLPMISRIKIMSNLTITEKRLPQDGSAVVRAQDQNLDLRVSTIPTPHGESMVIRILPTKNMLMSLEKLGFNLDNAKKFRELIQLPHGIIFVTGPTGSGKTTTLYACLNEINAATRKIITIEDPVEFEMEGITQIQINQKVDLDFAKGLRSILRHDPDILMVGEVRDLETAEIAIRTALTGHLVFSTLHTNDAASGITRLIDMGVEPYLVASSVEAFVAQRLVRIICPQCKEKDVSAPQPLREEIAASLKIPVSKVEIFKGKGCDHCNRTGYYGRTAIYEILEFNEAIRDAILKKLKAEDIKRLAVQTGMVTLRQNGWKNVVDGRTTPSEVMNVTVREHLLHAAVSAELATPPGNVHQRRELSGVAADAKGPAKSRLYARTAIEIPVKFGLTEKDAERPDFLKTVGEKKTAMTQDLSATGLTFVAPDFLQPGAILELAIDVEEGKPPVECLAKVSRVNIQRSPGEHFTGQYVVAVYYLDIPSADRARIDQFVKSRSRANLPSS